MYVDITCNIVIKITQLLVCKTNCDNKVFTVEIDASKNSLKQKKNPIKVIECIYLNIYLNI